MQESLRLSSRLKIAEFRMKWIDEYRNDLSHLSKIRTEMIFKQRSRNKASDADEKSVAAEKLRALSYETILLRSRLLLRLKPNSDDPDEQRLETLLKKAMDNDPAQAVGQRKEFIERSRVLLKREWERVKSDLDTQ
jgi:hypothetical protein